MRIVFAGTPAFALPSLDAVRAADHELVGVVTQPDRPAGRGRKLTPSPVKQAALQASVPVIEADRLKNGEAADRLAALEPDLLVVVAYGAILGRRVLTVPTTGCVNVHGSLLPRWRGAAPIARALLAGDETTGVTLTWMRPALDSGPIIAARSVTIDATSTAASLHDELAGQGGQLLAEYLALDCDRWPAIPQDDSLATYAPLLEKSEGKFNWSAGAAVVVRHIRAMQPWPVAFATLDGASVRVFEAEATDRQSGQAPGSIVEAGENGIVVASSDFDVRIDSLQFPGKQRMAAPDAARGRTLVGQRFG